MLRWELLVIAAQSSALSQPLIVRRQPAGATSAIEWLPFWAETNLNRSSTPPKKAAAKTTLAISHHPVNG